MAKDDVEGQSNQLNLTVVALVALVAIVGLVALVMNTASVARLATGGSFASAQSAADVEQNTAGQVFNKVLPEDIYAAGGCPTEWMKCDKSICYCKKPAPPPPKPSCESCLAAHPNNQNACISAC